MTPAELRQSAVEGAAPPDLEPLLNALWWAAHGDWNRSHGIAQDVGSRDGAWVHAYLHRAEGDLGNAGYWYRQAGRPVAKVSLEEEWEQIAGVLLGAQAGTVQRLG